MKLVMPLRVCTSTGAVGLLFYWLLIHSRLLPLLHAQQLQVPSPNILGAQLPLDEQAMFRLPNQSEVCRDFIHTFYLDKSAPDIVPPNRPFWDLASWNSWSERRQSKPLVQSHTSALSSSGSKQSEHLPISPIKFDHYFDKSAKDWRPLLYTFTSPAYPNNYPPNLDCIKVIRIPDRNHRILLDFRGEFLLEPSPGCVNDYLEVRDGEFGFSPLIGRFCTDSWFTHSIVSTGPWLWLRFHSDFSIEKRGFQAVFYYDEIPESDKPPTSLKPFTARTVINFDKSGIFDRSNLTHLLQTSLQSTSKSRSWMATRLQELIIDFRTNNPRSHLLLHLAYLKFRFIDVKCKYNLVEIYQQFFLTGLLESHSGTKASPSRSRFGAPSLHIPKVIKACNKPSLGPVLHKLGRGIVRILSSTNKMPEEPDEAALLQMVHNQEPTKNVDATLSLPELTLVYTELTKAPCNPGWMPCMKMEELRIYQDKLNASGLSIGEVLTPKPGKVIKYSEEQLNGLDIESIYCVSEILLCDTHINCPNGEDEDECPRARGDLDKILEHNEKMHINLEDESTLTTTTAATVNEKSNADDEFPHHTWIIVGLLGFCAMCGLLSAGVTLVKRAKETKRGSMSGMCNKVFFASQTSIVTTLESGTALEVRTGVEEPLKKVSKIEVDGYGPVGAEAFVAHSADPGTKDAGWCSSSCVTKPARAQEGAKRKARRTRSLPNSEVGENEQNCKVESQNFESKQTSGMADRTVRNFNGDRRATSSPTWNKIKSNQSSISNLIRQPREFDESESCLVSQGSRRSTAASFGHLPNTVVFPVEKLSDVVYHCGEPSGMALNKAWWNRSVPLPLAEETGAQIVQRHHPSEHLQETHSAKCLSGRFHSEDRNVMDMNQTTELPVHPPTAMANPMRDVGTTYLPHMPDARITATTEPKYFPVSMPTPDNWNHDVKPKHFRGGAPKRARYSIDPKDEDPGFGARETVGKGFAHCEGLPNEIHTTKAALWTSSCSTSGELLDDWHPESRTLPHRSTVHQFRGATGRETYSHQRTQRDPTKGNDKGIEPDDDHGKLRQNASSHTVEGIRGGGLHHRRCQTSDTTYSAMIGIQHQTITHQGDRQNTILAHRRALPCNCRFGGTKFTFPSSLSVMDQKTLERRHAMNNRNASLEDFRVNQYDKCGSTSSQQQNSEETETESRSEEIQEETIGRIYSELPMSDSQSASSDQHTGPSYSRYEITNGEMNSASAIIITTRNGVMQVRREKHL